MPGVLGNEASTAEESHSPESGGLLEYPQYTRPPEFRGLGVPEVLLGGNHGAIARFRKEQAYERTRERRPDLARAPCDSAGPAGSSEERPASIERGCPRARASPGRRSSGAVITTAITNLDLHDIARSACTYGVSSFFVVHPVSAQRELALRIKSHWVGGSGARRIPTREPAMSLLEIVPSLDDVYAALGGRAAIDVYATSARSEHATPMQFGDARTRIAASERRALILFGTGWGLTDELLAGADVLLAPIAGANATGYNHLSVRAACAIVLDRLLSAI